MSRPETAQDVAALTARVDRLEERLRRVQAAPPAVASTGQTPAPAAGTPPRSVPHPPAKPTPVERSSSEAPFESASAPVLAVVAPPLPPIDGLTLEAVQTAWPAAGARIRGEAGVA